MAKHNGTNERIKRDYFHYLKEARRNSTASVDAAAKAISRFEEVASYRDFRKFHREQAVAFKRKLSEQHGERSGKPLSKSTVDSTLRALREFFIWLAMQPGYKSQIQFCDADYFNLPAKDVAIARAKRVKHVPTLKQMHHALSAMPHETPIERRDRAVIALAMLTGARVKALATLQLKHIDIKQGMIDQDARVVQTKFAKTFSTWFLPIGGDAQAIITDWVRFLQDDMLWGEDDPLFPATQVGLGERGGFVATGLNRKGWATSAPIRDIFRKAFAIADLPYFNPHTLRDMLMRLGQKVCTTPEEFKAWSQNIGHASVMTSFMSYGEVPAHRQAELIRGMGHSPVTSDPLSDPAIREMLKMLAEHQLKNAKG